MSGKRASEKERKENEIRRRLEGVANEWGDGISHTHTLKKYGKKSAVMTKWRKKNVWGCSAHTKRDVDSVKWEMNKKQ